MAQRWGVAGLTVSAGIASWVELVLLRRSLNRRIGPSGLAAGYLARICTAALAAAGIGWLLHTWLGPHPPVLTAIVVLLPYGLVYFAVARLLGLSEARTVLRYFRSR
jgi:putative peptidoglycan lipid II flippase